MVLTPSPTSSQGDQTGRARARAAAFPKPAGERLLAGTPRWPVSRACLLGSKPPQPVGAAETEVFSLSPPPRLPLLLLLDQAVVLTGSACKRFPTAGSTRALGPVTAPPFAPCRSLAAVKFLKRITSSCSHRAVGRARFPLGSVRRLQRPSPCPRPIPAYGPGRSPGSVCTGPARPTVHNLYQGSV